MFDTTSYKTRKINDNGTKYTGLKLTFVIPLRPPEVVPNTCWMLMTFRNK